MIKLVSTLAITCLAAPALAGSCPTDLDGDGGTGFSDLTAMLNSWGPCPGCPGDLNGDDAVGFADLTELLNTWGPCPIDTFDYPVYENLFAVEVGQQFAGPAGLVALPQSVYDRVSTDIENIKLLRPEIASSAQAPPHMWRWEPFEMLVGIDTALSSDDFEATLAYYQGSVINSWFDGTILHLDFPMGANPLAMIPILEAVDSVEYAEPNNYVQTGALTPRWEPADIGGGALLWTVVMGWDQGDICNTNSSTCECFSTYEFLTQANGSVTLLGIDSVPSPWNQDGTCAGYPPLP